MDRNDLEKLGTRLTEAWYLASSDPREALAEAGRVSEELAAAREEPEFLDAVPALDARLRLVRANANYRLMEVQASLHDGLEARKEYEKLGDRAGVALACKTIGTTLTDAGDYEGAIDAFEKALAALRGLDEPEIEAAARNNYGEVFRTLGRLDEALSMYERALSIGRRAGFRGAIGIYLGNIGLVQLAKGELAEAEARFRAALAVFSANENPAGAVEAMQSLGEVVFRRGDPVAAETRYREAVAMAERSGVPLAERDARLAFGRFLLEAGKSGEAAVETGKALDVAISSGAERVELACRALLSEIAAARGEWQEAFRELKASRELEARIAGVSVRRQLSALQARSEFERKENEARIYRLETVELRKKNEELEAAYQRMRLVATHGRAILASLDMEEALSAVRMAIDSTITATVIGIAEVDGAEGKVSFRLIVERGTRVPVFEVPLSNPDSLVAYCARNRTEIVMTDVEKQYRRYVSRLQVRGDRGASVVFLPLVVSDEVVGVLMTEADGTDAFSDGDIDFLRALSLYVGQSIRNCALFELETARREAEIHRLKHVELREKHEELERALSEVRELARREVEYKERLVEWNANLEYEVKRRTEELEQLASTDPLTRLPNRRRAMEAVVAGVHEARRYGRALSVAMIDVDHFKQVNDRFGHAEGDRVLTEIAAVVVSTLRESDLAGRYGGEEFVMVLPETCPDGAVTVAERLRERVAGWDFGPVGKVTVSVGIAGFGPDDEARAACASGLAPEELLDLADRALYRAKSEGRNRVRREGLPAAPGGTASATAPGGTAAATAPGTAG